MVLVRMRQGIDVKPSLAVAAPILKLFAELTGDVCIGFLIIGADVDVDQDARRPRSSTINLCHPFRRR
jgi:hypothetical protein